MVLYYVKDSMNYVNDSFADVCLTIFQGFENNLAVIQ